MIHHSSTETMSTYLDFKSQFSKQEFTKRCNIKSIVSLNKDIIVKDNLEESKGYFIYLRIYQNLSNFYIFRRIGKVIFRTSIR